VKITVDHEGFYRSLALNGSIGAAESYMRGEWRVDDLVLLVRLMVKNRSVLEEVDGGLTRILSWANWFHHRLRANSLSGSKKNIVAHYDLSNDFYSLFLDRTMTYSSAVFPHQGATLEEASLEKIHRICRKLQLSPNDHVLEIGTGWGSFAIQAAARYGCRVTTTTISDEQYRYAKQLVEEMRLSDRVAVLNQDYRTIVGEYDKIVSIEMIEAVGYKYVPAFFEQCHHLLKADGVMALQAITMSDHLFDSYRKSVDFIQRYVFPGACLVSMQQVYSTLKRHTDFRVVHVEDITSHYAQTLRCWRERYMQHLDDVRELGFSEQFVRLWEFYLAYCEGGFRERQTGTVQMILARHGYRDDADLDKNGAPHS
jgi:cyclopropane-fatty-acyl-phospholipid synthase